MKKKETFEASFGRLQEILTKMENPDTSLDDSLALYAEGAKLVKSCMQQLEGKGRLYLARPLSRSWDYAPEK